MESRYRQLHIRAALSRRYDYSHACKELACILQKAYYRAPKTLQVVLYEDVLMAFRLIAGMDLYQHCSGAEGLLRAAEATFPKKKRAAAVAEYKQAVHAQHRLSRKAKMILDSEAQRCCLDLSGDLLLHIFRFLDVRSLAFSSAVCRAWNDAASCDKLWRRHYYAMFHVLGKSRGVCEDFEGKQITSRGHVEGRGYWQKALAWRICQPGGRSQLLSSNRAFCIGCQSLFWITERPTKQENGRFCLHENFRPVHRTQVRTFVLREPNPCSSSSSSDSETEEYFKTMEAMKWGGVSCSRFWSYPRIETE